MGPQIDENGSPALVVEVDRAKWGRGLDWGGTYYGGGMLGTDGLLCILGHVCLAAGLADWVLDPMLAEGTPMPSDLVDHIEKCSDMDGEERIDGAVRRVLRRLVDLKIRDEGRATRSLETELHYVNDQLGPWADATEAQMEARIVEVLGMAGIECRFVGEGEPELTIEGAMEARKLEDERAERRARRARKNSTLGR